MCEPWYKVTVKSCGVPPTIAAGGDEPGIFSIWMGLNILLPVLFFLINACVFTIFDVSIFQASIIKAICQIWE